MTEFRCTGQDHFRATASDIHKKTVCYKLDMNNISWLVLKTGGVVTLLPQNCWSNVFKMSSFCQKNKLKKDILKNGIKINTKDVLWNANQNGFKNGGQRYEDQEQICFINNPGVHGHRSLRLWRRRWRRRFG
jgi:hypothetical protein